MAPYWWLGLLAVAYDSFYALQFTVAICSTLVHFVVNCGFLPPIMGHCGSLWLAVVDCGSL